MQKNKFVHEDIKAVCNSAVKKLVVLGLVAATTAGGASFAAVSHKNIASAQTDEPNEHLGKLGEQQQSYDATWSYHYVNAILRLFDQWPPSSVIEDIRDYQTQLSFLPAGVPENLKTEYEARSKQVSSTGKFDSGFFINIVDINKWLYEHDSESSLYEPEGDNTVDLLHEHDSESSLYEPEGGNTVDLLHEHDSESHFYNPEGGNTVDLLLEQVSKIDSDMEYFRQRANRYNLEALATNVEVNYTRFRNSYLNLVERVRESGGVVDTVFLNELIELRVNERNTHHDYIAAIEAEEQARHEAEEQARHEAEEQARREAEERERKVREIRARANEQLRHDPNWPSRLEAVLTRSYNHDLALGLSEAFANANRERYRQRLMADPAEIDAFEAFMEREREIEAWLGAGAGAVTATTALRPAQQNQETGSQQTITGNTMLQVRGTNLIGALADTHTYPLSNNELMHEGNGAVNVYRNNIIISDFSNGRTARDVVVNEANSLTVAPGISTRIQNGTEFTMGETLQETAENILRALSPNSLLNIINRFGSTGGSK